MMEFPEELLPQKLTLQRATMIRDAMNQPLPQWDDYLVDVPCRLEKESGSLNIKDFGSFNEDQYRLYTLPIVSDGKPDVKETDRITSVVDAESGDEVFDNSDGTWKIYSVDAVPGGVSNHHFEIVLRRQKKAGDVA